MASGNHETEVKLAVANARAARSLLRAAGFEVYRPRVFEANTVYDTASLEIRESGRLLRLRRAGSRHVLTYKGPATVLRHKSREELEIELSDGRLMGLILERLGFRAEFRYEKYRTEFRRPRERGVATVDETPIGVFLELEGTPAWIDRTARRLGFSAEGYITVSYGRLYLDWCRRLGIEPTNMTFE